MHSRRRNAGDRKERLAMAKQGLYGNELELAKESSFRGPANDSAGDDGRRGCTKYDKKAEGSPRSRSTNLRDCCILMIALGFFVFLEVRHVDKSEWGTILQEIPAKLFGKNITLETKSETTVAAVKEASEVAAAAPEEGDEAKTPVQENPATIEEAATTTTTETANNPPQETPPTGPVPTTIAYVVPFFMGCNPNNNINLVEAAMVLRHSIHLQSARTPASGSRFDYKLYALILKGKNCPTKELEQLGYTVHTVDTPVIAAQIEDEYVRTSLQRPTAPDVDEGGMTQFIQLHAHDMVEEPIFVCLYVHSLVTHRLDELFESIHYLKTDPKGIAARESLQLNLERPDEELRDRIDNFFVRDYPNTGFGRKPVIQRLGFWVARKNPDYLQEAINLVHKGKYVQGQDQENGWGGKGYSWPYFQQGLTMPGLYAYFLDEFHAETSVELSGCKFNHNGMDNRFRAPPRYHPSLAKTHNGECRSGEPACGVCTTTEPKQIFHILYDHQTCNRPWRCWGEGEERPQRTKINTECVKLDHCMALQKEWHMVRHEIEKKLELEQTDAMPPVAGEYKREFFGGHCSAHDKYINILNVISEDTKKRIAEIMWGGQ